MLALVLVLVWAGLWVASLRAGNLVGIGSTYIPDLGMLAGDFQVSIEPTARRWAAGENFYLAPHRPGDPILPYPPMIPRAFGWVRWVEPATATTLWVVALGAIFLGAAGWVAWTRSRLGLSPIAGAWLVLAGLGSAPVVVAMERGQADPLALGSLILAAVCLDRSGRWSEPVAGVLLGVSCWLKYYPTAALLAVLLAGRWRAVAVAFAVAGAIGVQDRVEVLRSIEYGRVLAQVAHPPGVLMRGADPLEHALGPNWPELRQVLPLRPPVWIRGARAVALILVPPVLAVAAALVRRRRSGPVTSAWLAPAMLWLTAAATFAMPYSNDYNLIFLPLAALAVHDRRDPLAIQLAVGAGLLALLPFRLPMQGSMYLVLKLVLLMATAAALVRRLDPTLRPAGAGPSVARAVPEPHWQGRAPAPEATSTTPLSPSEDLHG